MSTRIYNLSQNSAPIPGPNFYYARDKEGKSTCRHTFTVIRGALGLGGIQAQFKKGTPITALDKSLSAFYSHLLVADFSAQDLPGGFCEVTVNCEGYTEGGEFETDREASYSLETDTFTKSILLNRVYLREVGDKGTRSAFAKMYNGLAAGEIANMNDGEITEVKVYDNRTDNEIAWLTDEKHCKWFRIIFIEDVREFEESITVWRRESTNAAGLTSSEIDAVNKLDPSPPGNPPTPSVPAGGNAQDWTWRKSQANEERGENSVQTQEAWVWDYWHHEIYEAKS